MKIVVDTETLAFLVGKAIATNRGATAGRLSANINLGTSGAPVVITPANVIDYIVDHGIVLDEANCPGNRPQAGGPGVVRWAGEEVRVEGRFAVR